VYDAATLRFAQFFQQTDWRRLVEQHADEIACRARQRVTPTGGLLEGEIAAEYLEQLIDAVTAEILKHHDAYGSVRWLWYLRRLPDDLFSGHRTTTLGYDRALAEALSWYLPATDESTSPTLVAFAADMAAFRHACRFVAGAKLLSHLHALYRRAGKGAAIEARSHRPFAKEDRALTDAIRTYDDRHHRTNQLDRSGLGLAAAEPDAESLEHNARADASSLFLSIGCRPIWIPVRGPDGSGGLSVVNVRARHALMSTRIETLLHPFAPNLTIRAPYLQAIEPLLLLLMLFPVLSARIPWALSSALQFGYFFARDDVLASLLDDWLSPLGSFLSELAPDIDWSLSYAEWRRRIDAIGPSLWPLRCGGVLRQQFGSTLVDFSTASKSLLQHLELDRTASELANDRALAFELQVQQIVDKSPWRPTPELAVLRGRALRRDGAHITDIDAIGAKGDTLLLVSCKSVIYDREYDKGTYRVVRNVQNTVDAAAISWQQFVSDVRAHGVGDNFDFSGFTRVIGIVCTPFVVYSSAPHTLAFVVDSLRLCSSAAELRDWLAADT
jgi:hypothetical protein